MDTHTDIKEHRRNQILSHATEIFSRKGFHEASVADIIERAGIARGTFYLYFDSKRDIFDSLLGNVLSELSRRIKSIELGTDRPDPLSQLKENIYRVLEYLIQNPALTQILLRHSVGLDQRSAATLESFYAKVSGMIERSLITGIEMGLLRQCDTRIVAAGVLGIMKEAANELTSRDDHRPAIDHVVDEIVAFGLLGVRNTSSQ